MHKTSYIAFLALLLLPIPLSAQNPERIIQYDEGIFGKVNIHDLENTPVTTYSPLTFVKRSVYVSEFTERMAIDKGQKHFYKYPEDSLDSRYVYRYIEPGLGLLDEEGPHMKKLTDYFHSRVEAEGAEAEPLARRIALARTYGLEILLNFRINDVHWGGPVPAQPELQSEFWLEHPEYYVNPDGEKWKDGALNFAETEVRAWYLQFYLEAVQRFDNDGILIDMMRNPTFFPPGTGWENREYLSEFLREVRRILDLRGQELGRKLALGIKVPPTLEYCQEVGMDVKGWAEEGLVDFLAVGTFMKQDPNLQVDRFREDLDRSDVPIYATVQRRNYGHGYAATSGQFRAMVANMYGNEKAEGLLLFNFMEQSREDYQGWKKSQLLNGANPALLSEFASLESLEGRNKVYSIAWGREDQYPDLPFFNPLPVVIRPGASQKLLFGVYETAVPERCVLALQFSGPGDFRVVYNGIPLESISPGQAGIPLERISGKGRSDKAKGVHNDHAPRQVYYFEVPPYLLRKGNQCLRVVSKENEEELEFRRSDLFIAYGPEDSHGKF